MFQPKPIIEDLAHNKKLFQNLLQDLGPEVYLWKSSPEKWCLLEIVCHLYDEEIEDFRSRVKHVLERPEHPMPPIDPVAWVKKRAYLEKDYNTSLQKFLEARAHSIQWLQNLKRPEWNNIYRDPRIEPRSAAFFLSNWLAHDYLHIRQILAVKHAYLHKQTGLDLSYAGNW